MHNNSSLLTLRFYTLQLIHPRGNTSNVTLFTRWGRVGETGQSQSKGPFPASKAVAEFTKQFKAKAAWDFSMRSTQMPKPNKYTWIERHYEDESVSTTSPKKAKQEDLASTVKEEPPEETIPESKSPIEVQNLVEFIFNPAYVLRISRITI
jgi:poly [ADP-ribose] polymerase 2/3/4